MPPGVVLFPFAEYWWLYAGFTAGVLVLLAVDLGVFHRDAHAVGVREAVAWSVTWVALALAVNYAFYRYALWQLPRDPRLAAMPGFDPAAAAWQVALEFLTGYIVEYSLSVDNIFVFVVVLGYFSVPTTYRHRVLFYGILGALIFRGVFIGVGAHLMKFHWAVWLFGAFLVFTGLKLMVAPERELEPERNLAIRLLRRLVPVTARLHGPRFFVRLNGVRHATPLFVALLFLEATDIVFAVDSVPAIFAITREPLIVFTSNVCAILGLRSLYFMLGGAVERFHLLRYGLALVLVFVGLKMVWLNDWYGGKFPIAVSLGIICAAIAGSVVASLLLPKAPGLPADRHMCAPPRPQAD